MYSNQWELSELSEWLLRSTSPGSVLKHLPHFIRTRAKRQNNECGFLSEVDQTSQGRTDRLGCCSGRNRCGGYLRHSVEAPQDRVRSILKLQDGIHRDIPQTEEVDCGRARSAHPACRNAVRRQARL